MSDQNSYTIFTSLLLGANCIDLSKHKLLNNYLLKISVLPGVRYTEAFPEHWDAEIMAVTKKAAFDYWLMEHLFLYIYI